MNCCISGEGAVSIIGSSNKTFKKHNKATDGTLVDFWTRNNRARPVACVTAETTGERFHIKKLEQYYRKFVWNWKIRILIIHFWTLPRSSILTMNLFRQESQIRNAVATLPLTWSWNSTTDADIGFWLLQYMHRKTIDLIRSIISCFSLEWSSIISK